MDPTGLFHSPIYVLQAYGVWDGRVGKEEGRVSKSGGEGEEDVGGLQANDGRDGLRAAAAAFTTKEMGAIG